LFFIHINIRVEVFWSFEQQTVRTVRIVRFLICLVEIIYVHDGIDVDQGDEIGFGVEYKHVAIKASKLEPHSFQLLDQVENLFGDLCNLFHIPENVFD